MGARAGLLTAAAVALLAGCSSGKPAAAPPPSSPSVPPPSSTAEPVDRQPDVLAFGQSTDFHHGVTVTVAAPKLAGFPYPSLLKPGEVGVTLPVSAHNDRQNTWVGCSYLYTYVGLPTGEQVLATGVADGGPSHDGPVSPGATADCTVYPQVQFAPHGGARSAVAMADGTPAQAWAASTRR